MEAVRFENVSFTYHNEQSSALKDIDMRVQKGEFAVIIGNSGCGKTTLLRNLKPTVAPNGVRTGNIYINGVALRDLSKRDAASKIGFVMQNPDAQIVTDKVWHELAFGLERLGTEQEVMRLKIAETVSFFGIQNLLQCSMDTLSGGQKQLINLASVMVTEPELLILDEPTAQLDPVAAARFLQTLKKINRELGVTVILSEHRLSQVLALASSVIAMQNGEILCCCAPRELGGILKDKKSDLFASLPVPLRLSVELFPECTPALHVNEGRILLQKHVNTDTLLPLEVPSTPPEQADICLNASEVFFRYEKNGTDVISDFSISAYKHRCLCLLGANGAGKSTALKLLAGIYQPLSGTVQTKGKVCLLPQDPTVLFTQNSVYEELLHAPNSKKTQKQAPSEVLRVINLCRLGGLEQRHPCDLSGGEIQRLGIAVLLLAKPDILLLDEPTKGLDAGLKSELAQMLDALKQQGLCLIMASHDLEFCAENADDCALVCGGTVPASAPNKTFFLQNRYYTTAVVGMTHGIIPNAVTVGDVYRAMGKTPCAEQHPLPIFTQTAQGVQVPQAPKAQVAVPLSKPRKITAGVLGASAVALFVYIVKTRALSGLIRGTALTQLGVKQLVLYGVFTALLFGLLGVSAQKSDLSPKKQMPKKEKRMHLFGTLICLLSISVPLFICTKRLKPSQYYVTSLLILLEAMLPVFGVFERKKPSARQLAVLATLCAFGIAGRAAFFMLPQFKPVLAITVLSGVALGCESGFTVGAVSMLVSNMLFSQGAWTPWQMFAMGFVGILAGLVFYHGKTGRTRLTLSLFGAFCAVFVYGGIVNPCSAFIWGGSQLNWQMLVSYYVTGFPMDAVHAAASFIFLWFLSRPILEMLERIPYNNR